MGYGENSNWLCHTVYLPGISGRSSCAWSTTSVSSTIPPGNKIPDLCDMANIASYQNFKYGVHMGFWLIYTFFINVHDWYYITCSNNQALRDSGRWNNWITQAGNWKKPFCIKHTCFVLYICYKKRNWTCWHKGVKHTSSITKKIWYLLWNNTISKWYLIYVPSTSK